MSERMQPADFITKALLAARLSGHIWPEYAVCEAALESGWGNSKLAIYANDLFGEKIGPYTREYPVMEIPTKEWKDGEWVVVMAQWPRLPDWTTAFRERMELLQNARNQDGLIYQAALGAQSGEDFVRLVSSVWDGNGYDPRPVADGGNWVRGLWATDPERSSKVLATYRAHFPAIAVDPAPAAEGGN